MYDIPNKDTQNYPSLDYNKRLKHLDTQLNEPTNPKFHKSSKNVKPTNKKNVTIKLRGLVS